MVGMEQEKRSKLKRKAGTFLIKYYVIIRKEVCKMITVRVPTPLRRITNGQGEVQVQASTVREAIEKLEEVYPGFKERLLDEKGEVRKFVNLYLNDEDIRFLKGLDTELKDGDVLSIVPAIAGGHI